MTGQSSCPLVRDFKGDPTGRSFLLRREVALFSFSKFPRLGAVRAYLVIRAIGSTGSGMAVFIALVYVIVDAGLDPLQLILVGTVLEATVFVFEIPTGVVSDVHSRRTSMIIGSALVG
jgi:hypothetical protein